MASNELGGASGTAPGARVVGLTAAVAVVGSNALALSPIAPAVGGDLAATAPSVMVASSAYGLGAAAAALFGGPAIDRLGPARALRLAVGALAAALAASAATPVLVVFVLAQGAAGLAAGVALPSAYARAAAIAEPGRESRTLGVVLTGWTVSMVCGVAIAAWTADAYGWRAVYALFAAAAAIIALTTARSDAEAPATTAEPDRTPTILVVWTPGVGLTLLACAAYMHAFYGVYAYLGDHLVGAGLDVGAAGLAAAAYGVGFGLAAFGDPAIDRMGPGRALVFALLAIAAVYGALAAAAGVGPWIVVAACAPWGLANHFGLNALIGRLTELAPTRRGRTLGLNTAVTYLSVFSGTLIFAPIYLAGGFASTAIVGAVLCAAGAAVAHAARGVTAE